MRNVILAVAFFVCVPAWGQTALPPQWGTSGNAAPTPKGKAGEGKKAVKVKPGKGAVTPPAQAAPAPALPVAPMNNVPAQPASAPVQPASAPVQPPFIPPPAQTVAAPAPTSSPPEAIAPVAAKSTPHSRAKAKPGARKKTADAALSTPAKPKRADAALSTRAKAKPADAALTTPAKPKPADAALTTTAKPKAADAALSTPAKAKPADAALTTPAKPKPADTASSAPARPKPTAPARRAPATPPAIAASPSAATPSAATYTPAAAAPTPAPIYVAPAFVPPPVTNYAAPAVPAPAPANSRPAYPAPAPYAATANPSYAAPPANYAPPSAASAEPLPGAAAPPPSRPAPQPLPSLVASSPRNRRKAAARDAALATSPPWIDISAPLSIGVTPAYPGTAPLEMRFDYDMDNGAPLDLSEFSMSMHTGTHVDAPLHFLRGAPSIDQVPLEQLNGPALVLNIDPSVTAITAAELERYPWRGARRILFRTRNSVNEWIVDPRFHPDYVYLAPDAAELLVSANVELVGIDYLSIEQYGAPARTHVILLSKGIAVVEGLDLRQVPAGEYDLTLLPLKILGHEAAPARAVLRRR